MGCFNDKPVQPGVIVNSKGQGGQKNSKQDANFTSKQRSLSKTIEKEQFLSFFPLIGLWGDQMFKQFQGQNSTSIGINEDSFIQGMSIFTRISNEDQIKLLFQMNDISGQQKISKEDLLMMLYNFPKKDQRWICKDLTFQQAVDIQSINWDQSQFTQSLFEQSRINIKHQITQKKEEKNLNIQIDLIPDEPKRQNLLKNQKTKNNSVILKQLIKSDDIQLNVSQTQQNNQQTNSQNEILQEKVEQVNQNQITEGKDKEYQSQKEKHGQKVLGSNSGVAMHVQVPAKASNMNNAIKQFVNFIFKEENCDHLNYERFRNFCIKHNNLLNIFYNAFHQNIWSEKEDKSMAFAEMSDITEHYILKEIIGTGKFSQVHRGLEKNNKENEWAVKVMDKLKLSQAEIQLLAHETEFFLFLNHPGIIKIKDTIETRQYIYIVCELVKNGDLFDYVTQNPKEFLEEYEACTIMKQLIDTVKYIHESGVVHRDLKPENIMVVLNEDKKSVKQIKIIDFGLSVQIKPGVFLNGIIGTLNYMAPEILDFYNNKEGYGKKIDNFSLGCIMFFMLRGSCPFDSYSEEEIRINTVNCNYSLIDEHWDNVTEDAKDLIRQLLKRDPNKRMEMEDALQHNWFKIRETELKRRIGINTKNTFDQEKEDEQA